MTPSWQRMLVDVATHHMTRAPLAEDPVDGLAEDYRRLIGRKHNIPVSSGTAAIHCALAGLGIEAGDEVLIPANTCAAVAMAVLAAGGLPIFVDVDETLTIAPDALCERITSRTRAVIVVHQFGVVADIEAVRRQLPTQVVLIEDCAQSVGATIAGRPTGTFGDVSIFSFAHGKIISAGHGGILSLDDDAVASRARRFANLGADRVPYYVERGLNYEMAPLAAVLVRQQLSEMESNLASRARLAALYDKFLTPSGFVTVTSRVAETTSAWHRCVMLAPQRGVSAEQISVALDAAGVAYQTPHPCPLYRSAVVEIIRAAARQYGSLLDPLGHLSRAEALGARAWYFRVGPEQSPERVEAALERLRI